MTAGVRGEPAPADATASFAPPSAPGMALDSPGLTLEENLS
jgi:hypothetical protein